MKKNNKTDEVLKSLTGLAYFQKDIFILYRKLILRTLAAAKGNIAQLNKLTPNSNSIEFCVSKP